MKPGFLLLLILAVLAISIADVFLKQASMAGNFGSALKTPWFWGAALLYLFQVGAFAYLFVSKVPLSSVGIIQTALYAVTVLGAGYFIYQEVFSPIQYVGMALAIVGVVLINLKG